MKAIRIVLVLIALGAAFLGGFIYAHRQQAGTGKGGRKILYYVDAMHPWYKSDKPGIAPDCGMKLVPVYSDGNGAVPSQEAERKVLYYRDPKDPKYKSEQPGINPETGNDLEP